MLAVLWTLYGSIWTPQALWKQIEANDDRSMTLQTLRIHSWRAEGENFTAQKRSEKAILAQIETCGAQIEMRESETEKSLARNHKCQNPGRRRAGWAQIQMRESETENQLSRDRKSTNPGLRRASWGKTDIRES